MEPESLVAFGYKVPESEGVRDKLQSSGSSMVASIGIASLFSGRELDGLAASFIFVVAAGSAPLSSSSDRSRVDHHSYQQLH
eukprot:121195-Amphidinium_carterae.1